MRPTLLLLLTATAVLTPAATATADQIVSDTPRLEFLDTSVDSFPGNDWAVFANDPTDGGLNRLGIEDTTTTRTPFSLMAGAPNDALVVAANGKVGLRTPNPGLDLSFDTSDTPAIRFGQNSSGGYTPQTWDVAGNEANWFVRDLSGGSKLPLRIRPGAATSTVDIRSGGVGILTDAPTQALDVNGTARARQSVLQGADPSLADNETPVDGAAVLAALRSLPLAVREYTADADNTKHLWPTAADFNAAFGLGPATGSIAPGDMAGVALAAVKALDARVSTIATTPGPAGADGPAGAQGPAGAAGAPGAQGPAGTPGDVASLVKRLNALESANRKLTTRVRTLERKLKPAKKKTTTKKKAKTRAVPVTSSDRANGR